MAIGSIQTSIWRGYAYTLAANNTPVTYSVELEGVGTIFTGVAVPNPATGVTRVELFDILAPYLKQAPAAIDELLHRDEFFSQDVSLSRRFTLVFNGQRVNFDMTGDWSYRYSVPVTILFDGVYGDTHPAGWPLVITTRYCVGGTVQLVHRNGTVLASYNHAGTSAANLLIPASVLPPVGQDFRVRLPDGTFSSYIRVVDGCGDWGLYYVNAYGGWDLLPIKGVVRRTDSFEREEHEINYSRSLTEGASRRIHRIDMGASWELNTGILSDAESARFSLNVPSTPLALLVHDAGQDIIPVAVTDPEIQHGKTAVNNSRVPASYTFNVRLQQDRIRL